MGQGARQTNTIKGCLYIVSTPIGNIADITLRALDTLKNADYILAEDTRHTAGLLQAHGISNSLKSYNDHNGEKRRPKILNDLANGKHIALVSDAGTPLISDPGWKLGNDAQKMGAEIVPVPGASAILAGLVKSGLPTDAFYFGGFLPQKKSAREAELSKLLGLNATLVFFETANRLHESIDSIAAVFGENCTVSVARELTKRFEQNVFGDFHSVLQNLPSPLKGEIVVCVKADPRSVDQIRIENMLKRLLQECSLKTSADIIGELGLLTRNEAYKMGLRLKNK